MWTIGQTAVDRVVCMGTLAVLAVIDIHSRQIPVRILIVVNMLAIGFGLWNILDGERNVILIAGGTGVGAIFFLISWITRESVGYGDSWVILILGIYLGLWELLELLTGSFFLLAVVSLVCLMAKKMSRRYRLPFLPFLVAGYLFCIVV